ncbi:endopeptidase La [Elusimicrobiota bacterium]
MKKTLAFLLCTLLTGFDPATSLLWAQQAVVRPVHTGAVQVGIGMGATPSAASISAPLNGPAGTLDATLPSLRMPGLRTPSTRVSGSVAPDIAARTTILPASRALAVPGEVLQAPALKESGTGKIASPLGSLNATVRRTKKAKAGTRDIRRSIGKLFDGNPASKGLPANAVLGDDSGSTAHRLSGLEAPNLVNLPTLTIGSVLLPDGQGQYVLQDTQANRDYFGEISRGKNGGYIVLTTMMNSNEGESFAVLVKLSKMEEGKQGLVITIRAEKRVRITGVSVREGRLITNVAFVLTEARTNAHRSRKALTRIMKLFNPKAEETEIDKTIDKVESGAQWNASVLELMERFSLQSQIAILGANSTHERLEVMAEIVERKLKENPGAGMSGDKDVDAFHERIAEAGMPDEVREAAEQELAAMAQMQPQSSEREKLVTYLNWLLKMPWQERTEDNLDLKHAKQVMDRDHYGLEKVKERVLEFLAVRKRLKDHKGTILLFSGPPGTGKTSIASAIAEAMDRKFQRISLGGVNAESKVRGHGRTYLGSKPGMIIDLMARAGTKNPVILLDEIEKMPEGGGANGDPTAALLEVLDPAQNDTFTDHYMNVPFDLSEVIFIATANDLDKIPGPLRDRMELVEFTSYTAPEKMEIAKRHLVPRARKATGLSEKEATVTDEAIGLLIDRYTMESGVRNLGRALQRLFRKLVALAETGAKAAFGELDPAGVEKYLGPPTVGEKRKVNNRVGVATGLAWTMVGGVIMQLEVKAFPDGRGKIEITGNLKQVMQESAKIALSHVRSLGPKLGIDPKLFNTMDLHIHFPEGATPKDGPSAGITMVTAIASRLTGRPVRKDMAMTGEVTLTGEVHPIGGLKEKSLAAYRLGYKKILFPKDNERDLVDIPQEVRDGMEFIPVETAEEVLEHSLEKKAAETPLAAPGGATSDKKA